MTTAAVSVQKLSVQLGETEALKGVTVDLPAGKIVGFIGPSGAGKTTLIRGIVGRQKLTSGGITIFGLSAGSAVLRSRISYMTQEVSVYGDLTVQENLHYFATMFGVPRAHVGPMVADIVRTVDLAKQTQQLVGSLSGGQKQRVSLAVALIGSPELMVLDEPTVGLDPVLREQLWNLFRHLAGNGTTLIVSSHVMDEAERCDELVLLRDGSVLAQGSPHELCKRTDTKNVEQAFLKLVKGQA